MAQAARTGACFVAGMNQAASRTRTADAVPTWSVPDRRAAAHSDDARFRLQLRVAAALVLLMPVNWLLGTTLIAVFAAALVLAFPVQRFSALEYAYGFLAAALVLGLAVALLQGVAANQIVGALFNVAMILALIAFAGFGRKAQSVGGSLPADRIYRAAFWCFWLQIAVIAVSYAYVSVSGNKEASFPSLLLGAGGELPGILRYYSSIFISVRDGISPEADPRVVGIGIYPTEGAILVLSVGLLASIHACRRRRYVLAVLVEVAMALALIEMASRTTLAAYLLSLMLLGALAGRKLLRLLLLSSPAIATALVLGAIYGPDLVASGIDAANQSRAASSGTRFSSYTLALELVLQHNPLTGLGILPKDPSLLEIPIGSHSSWTSLLTRGGLVALAAWIAVNVVLLAKIVRAQILVYRDRPRIERARRIEFVNLGRCVLVLMLWWVTEDFDFPAHEVAVAGLAVGLLWGALERERAPTRLGWAAPLGAAWRARRLLNGT